MGEPLPEGFDLPFHRHPLRQMPLEGTIISDGLIVQSGSVQLEGGHYPVLVLRFHANSHPVAAPVVLVLSDERMRQIAATFAEAAFTAADVAASQGGTNG